MANKSAEIKIMVLPEVKKKIRQKAESLGLSITAFVEKVACEELVFLDQNTKSLLRALELK